MNDTDAVQKRTETRASLSDAITQARNTTPARPAETGTAAWLEARILQVIDMLESRELDVQDVYVRGTTDGPDLVRFETGRGPRALYVTYVEMDTTLEGAFEIEYLVPVAGISAPVLGFNGDGLDDETLDAAYSLVADGMPVTQAVDVARSLTGKP